MSQPNIGRPRNGRWAVRVSNGYFPDCSTADIPTLTQGQCTSIANQVPKNGTGADAKPRSALFVLTCPMRPGEREVRAFSVAMNCFSGA